VSDSPGPAIPGGAEATDGDELGEEVGDQTLPGTDDFPPDRPSGVGSPESLAGVDHHDSATERRLREVPEESTVPEHEIVVLVDPDTPGGEDDEDQSLGERVPSVGPAGPEEAAMHLDDEDRDIETEIELGELDEGADLDLDSGEAGRG
jgi:hypothetical protein